MALIDAAARYQAALPKNPRCVTCQFLERHPDEANAIADLLPVLGALVITELLAQEYPGERVPGQASIRSHVKQGH